MKNELKKSKSQKSSDEVPIGTGADDFYLYIYDEEEDTNQLRFKKNKKSLGRNWATSVITNRKIGFWCFNAGIGMKSIANLKPRSIILTSGTLSPMDSFQSEMGIEFKQKLENPHVIDAK